MGCPAKHVTGGQSGSALMRDLDHALTLIDATVGAVSVPVTLKMRLGWDDASRNAPELARRAEAAGMQLITVHGRTRCQFYKGSADWAAVRAVKQAVSIPVVVNGDVTSFDGGRRGARAIRRRCRDGRPRRAGPAVVSGTARALSWRPARRDADPSLDRPARARHGALRGDADRIMARASACAMRASISAGRSMPPPRPPASPPKQLKSARAHVLTSEDPAEAQRRPRATPTTAFGWRAAA